MRDPSLSISACLSKGTDVPLCAIVNFHKWLNNSTLSVIVKYIMKRAVPFLAGALYNGYFDFFYDLLYY